MSEHVSGGGDSGPALGAILAGGRGSRIGGSKATVELNSRPLISYPLAAVEHAGLAPVVVAKRDSELPPLACTVVREPERPRHPLCGIVAALRHAGERPLVVVACDMPFVSAGLLAWLASLPEPLAVPSLDGGPQPLLGRYDSVLLPALEKALVDEEPLRHTVESLGARFLAEAELARFGEPRRLCANVNTLGDLDQLG